MKTKRTFIPVFTLSVALLLTACNGKEAADTKKTQTTQTESGTEAVTGSVAESGTETAGASGTKLDDLYQQENQIFADHADVWNKVFGMMNKSTADPSGNYADYLADTVEANKDSFSEDELNTLTDDIETIRKSRNRWRNWKTAIQHRKIAMRKTIPKRHLRSGISRARIMMATPLTKVCFPKMR